MSLEQDLSVYALAPVCVAEGDDHVWICELGRRAEGGAFDAFCARIAAAPLRFGRRSVVYDSPAQGRLAFGWRGPLRRDGEALPQGGFPRYDSPWVRADFPAERVEARCGDAWLALDWTTGERRASGSLW